MPKGPSGQKREAAKPPVPPKSKKLPRKLPDDPIARGVAIMREATERDAGDLGDKITRAPKKRG
jgi:hypothetical protein